MADDETNMCLATIFTKAKEYKTCDFTNVLCKMIICIKQLKKQLGDFLVLGFRSRPTNHTNTDIYQTGIVY